MGYLDIRQKIIDTLTGRAVGTQIQPTDHQEFALMMLDYIRNVELVSSSTLVGIADERTVPVQPNNSNACYISSCPVNGSVTFDNFRGQDGEPVRYSSETHAAAFIILTWNKQYWEIQGIPIGVKNPLHEPISESEFEEMMRHDQLEVGVYYPTYEDD